MDPRNAVIDSFLQGLTHFRITQYGQLASASIVIYEHILTLDAEIQFIWKSPLLKANVLFVLNRYYSLGSFIFNTYVLFNPTVTPSFCSRLFQWQGWTGLIACMLAQSILQVRIYAMYSLNKVILAIMVVPFLSCVATSAWIMYTALAKIQAIVLNVPNGRTCTSLGVPQTFYTFWIPLLLFECLLCALALTKGFQALKTTGSVFQAGRRLIQILFRDSLLYFLVICATYLTCLVVWYAAPVTLLEVPIGFSLAMSCVIANRIILNLRQEHRDRYQSA